LVVNSYHEDTTKRVAAEVEKLGRRVLSVAGDATRRDTILQAVEKAVDTFGRIDILANNIGSGPVTPRDRGSTPLEAVEASWDDMYEQNLKATVLTCEAVAPLLKEQKSGKIINIASIAGRAVPSLKVATHWVPPAYSAMKAALLNYSQQLSVLLGPYNINVNCICPGIVYTDAWKRGSEIFVEKLPEFKGMDPVDWFPGIAEGKYPELFQATPMRRRQTAEDIGRAAVFLASEDSKNITGQAFNVDGGMVRS
jgi:NAD(P)-dependent dehydrogenase (short-subunit alcohol dehydrogenase family)